MSVLDKHHGAFVNKDGTTHFAFWAPDAISVDVKLNDNNVHSLSNTDGDGWFTSTIECGAGTGYQYIIDGKLEVPDPASRMQCNDVHSFSCIVDQAYPWQTVTWQGRPWHEAIIYELHVGLMGGFKKVEEYLPTLVELGITAIELMPINEFPGSRNWGYDGVLLFSPESSYGTPDELKSLIDTAHSLDLMVFLDVVYNHFGPDGNYINHYAKDFFRHDLQTSWGAAINFRRQEVKDFFCENALMWIIDYRIDGLRIDAAHAINDKEFLIELATRVRHAVLPTRHVHLILENENNMASLLEKGFTAQWNDDGHNVIHHLLTGEHEGYYADFVESPTKKLARCLSDGFIYQGEMNQQGKSRGEPSSHLPPTSFVLFLQNHDQIGNRAFGERLTQLVEPNALKAAVVLLLLSPMVPLLFMGEEWASKNPFLFFTDHNDELGKAVCEGRRKEFAHFSAFNDVSVRAIIPNPNIPSTFEKSMLDHKQYEQPEHQEWKRYYHHLLEVRRTEIIPRLVDTQSAGVTILSEGAVSAAWKMGDGCVLRIYLNFSSLPVSAEPHWANARLIFNHQVQEIDYQEGVLPPYSAFVTMEEKASMTMEESNLMAIETSAYAEEPTSVKISTHIPTEENA